MPETTSGQGSPEVSSGDPGPADTGGHVPAPTSARLEILSAVVCLAVSVLLFLYAPQIELRAETSGINPRWWPRTLGLAGMAASFLLLVTAILRSPPDRGESEAATHSGRVRLALVLGLAVAYIVLWPAVGFLPTTLALLVAATAVFGGRTIGSLLIFPVVMTAALYLVFDVALKVPL